MSLDRFVNAQEKTYAGALAELKSGRKTGHWIWWIFPQLKGLGRSENSVYYGLADEAEARDYLRHPILGPRYQECMREVWRQLAVNGCTPLDLMGSDVDVLKLRSSLEVFNRHAYAVPAELCGLPAIIERLLVEKFAWKHPLDGLSRSLRKFNHFDQYLAGEMLREGHVLLAGVTGSGKSCLLNTQLLPWILTRQRHCVVVDLHGDLDPIPRGKIFDPLRRSADDMSVLAEDALRDSVVLTRNDPAWASGGDWNLFLVALFAKIRMRHRAFFRWFVVVDVSSHFDELDALWDFLPDAATYGCQVIVTVQGAGRLTQDRLKHFSVLAQFLQGLREDIHAVAPPDVDGWAKAVTNLNPCQFLLKTKGFAPRAFEIARSR